MNLNDRKTFKFKITWLIFLIPAIYLPIEFIWKPLFVQGKVLGVYWLFVFADKTTLSLVPVMIFLSFVFFVMYPFIKFDKNKSIIGEVSSSFFLGGLFLAFTFLFGIFPVEKTVFHLDELRVREKVYYLSSTDPSSLDTNFSLYECDSFGIICKRVYHSSNYETGHLFGGLTYDQVTDKILINIPSYGNIYSYKLP